MAQVEQLKDKHIEEVSRLSAIPLRVTDASGPRLSIEVLTAAAENPEDCLVLVATDETGVVIGYSAALVSSSLKQAFISDCVMTLGTRRGPGQEGLTALLEKNIELLQEAGISQVKLTADCMDTEVMPNILPRLGFVMQHNLDVNIWTLNLQPASE